MARRQRLSETQIAELFEPPTEQRELIRHFTLSEAEPSPKLIWPRFVVAAAITTASVTR